MAKKGKKSKTTKKSSEHPKRNRPEPDSDDALISLNPKQSSKQPKRNRPEPDPDDALISLNPNQEPTTEQTNQPVQSFKTKINVIEGKLDEIAALMDKEKWTEYEREKYGDKDYLRKKELILGQEKHDLRQEMLTLADFEHMSRQVLNKRDSVHKYPNQSQGISDFWESLADLIPDEHDIIHFKTLPAFFPANMNSLYIRQSYRDLYSIICNNINLQPPKRLHRMAITGNPGIGKSIFLFYILWELSKSTPTVIMRREKDEGTIFVFQKKRCWRTKNPDDIDGLLEEPTTWYLTDTLSKPPGEIIKAVTIVVASPARKHYKEFLKHSATAPLHYMPIWSLDELHIARQAYSMSAEEVEKGYCLIGGIPRFVLEKQQDIQDIIDEAIGRLAIEKIDRIASGNVEKGDEISHLIVHYDVDLSYKKKSLCLGSTYITEKALERFLSCQESELKRFLNFSEPTPLLATLRGNLFEAYSHRLLAAGGKFAIRSLEGGEPLSELDGGEHLSELTLPKCKMTRFYKISECQNNDSYYVPWNPNFPCIDSYLPNIGFFQMTVSQSHPIKKAKMKDIIKDTKTTKDIIKDTKTTKDIIKDIKTTMLYFVVPKSLYKDFPLQKVSDKHESIIEKEDKEDSDLELREDSKSSKRGDLESMKKQKVAEIVRQFALCIEIE